MSLLRRRRVAPAVEPGERPGFTYLDAEHVYLDSACQTMRPDPVVDALNEYYLTYNACGDRVKYRWGKQVDEKVEATRAAVLRTLGLPARRYEVSFTLNTTYGLNLMLGQLPGGRFRRVVTTHTEHNSVFLSTMSFARRTGVERVLLDRADDGTLRYDDAVLRDALVVVSAMNNVDGAPTRGLPELVAAAHKVGGVVVVDAAQAMAHGPDLVRGLRADAVVFSAHKLYGASLGVVAATAELLASLEVSFIGGGQVLSVTAADYTLAGALHTRLEPGLQPWGEIVALGAALDWFDGALRAGEHARQTALAERLYDGLVDLPRMRLRGERGSTLLSLEPQRVDGHRLAGFLSRAGIMVRSGYFCAHHWLVEQEGSRPLTRFSLGAHNTTDDVDHALEVTGTLLRGL